MSRNRLVAAGGLIAVAAAVFLCWPSPSADRLLGKSARALSDRRYVEAERFALEALSISPESPHAIAIAAEVAIERGREENAVDYLTRPFLTESAEGRNAIRTSAERLMQRGRLSAAERLLRVLLAHDPADHFAIRHLAFLLAVEGRRWESLSYLLALVRRELNNVDELILLGHTDLLVDMPPELRSAASTGIEDPLSGVWQARAALRSGNDRDAEMLLRKVLTQVPGQVEAHVRLGAALLHSTDPDAIVRWQENLPPEADGHPEAWVVRGAWLESRSELPAAARCYWEAVSRNPDHRTANYRLAQVLTQLGQDNAASPFRARAMKLEELERILLKLYLGNTAPNRTELMQEAAQLTESLGRLWEAFGWCREALKGPVDPAWATQGIEQLRSRLHADGPRVQTDLCLACQTDLSAYPLPAWGRAAAASRSSLSDRSAAERVRFTDLAAAAGLDFHYFNSGRPREGTKRMYEGNGGGVAILDYDKDGWPDVYLSQGCQWPPAAGQRAFLDQLFRNVGNGRFFDATAASGMGDDGFSQGTSVGDIDSDGFPDVYVANIGANRLYRSNGDGTFSDVTAASGTAGEEWSTSSAFADLNLDGQPDLYVVNYLGGEDVFDKVCRSAAGIDGLCAPSHFPGAQDRLYLNRGDGRFIDATTRSGIVQPDGKGLGVLAADLSGSGRLEVFVANDGVANFHFRNEHAGDTAFVQAALETGLAFNGDGLPEACMGIAAGDADGDGRIDLFVTNFYRESNTLYLQREAGLFMDATRRTGLHGPSLTRLGFGTQFVDGELDGSPDLFVANGHVDNATPGQPYAMQPQYFRNLGGGRFEEAPVLIGEYFGRACLGRSAARVDWNRDGREDVVVSHLDAPVALLTNQTFSSGRFLAIRLCGVQSARDPIGCVVRLRIGEREWVQQLTSGDGFQASNQRQLIFGLGAEHRVDALVVDWPSGLSQTFRELDANQELVLVEGKDSPMPLPRLESQKGT